MIVPPMASDSVTEVITGVCLATDATTARAASISPGSTLTAAPYRAVPGRAVPARAVQLVGRSVGVVGERMLGQLADAGPPSPPGRDHLAHRLEVPETQQSVVGLQHP